MIDLDGMKAYIDARINKKYFIHQGSTITAPEVDALVNILKEYGLAETTGCFAPRPDGNCKTVEYAIKAPCDMCGKPTSAKMLKTHFLAYLKRKSQRYSVDQFVPNNIHCKKCKAAIKAQKEQEKLDRETARTVTRIRNTQEYFSVFLNPKYQWNKETKLYHRIASLRDTYLNWEAVCERIKSMKYYDFLKTPYWVAISQYKKKQAGFKCQICNSPHNLATHHRTYAIHGPEIHNMNELIVLCKGCHEKHHNI